MPFLPDVRRMTTRQTVTLWQNAQRILRDPAKAAQHDNGRRVLDEIHIEWARRWDNPQERPFDWPSTDAKAGHGQLSTEQWIKEGLLKEMGYQVGLGNGSPPMQREAILSGIFECVVPPIFVASYATEWGRPKSAERLRKMAETVAALVRNAKRRRDARMGSAIKDWESDLEFLYFEYYVDRFHFAWPSASV